MDVRLWACEAHAGTVLGELPAVGSTSLSMALGGGRVEATIPLGRLVKRDGTPDMVAAKHYLGLCSPGSRTIVATTGTTVLGEWLILTRQRGFAASTVRITGAEWEDYPRQRQVHTGRILSGDLTGLLARTFLQDLFTAQNGNISMAVPATSAGLSRAVTERGRSGRYYSDVLADLADQTPGFEWRVDVTGSFQAEALTSISRAVVFGSPTLLRGTTVPIAFPEPGSRSGAGFDLSVDEDFDRNESATYVLGAGDGAKQVQGDYQGWNARSENGWVSRTRAHSRPDVTSVAVANQVAHQLSNIGQSIFGADGLEVLIDRLPSIPRVGGRVSVSVPPSLVLPDGYTAVMRVGEVILTLDAGRADTVRLRAAQEVSV